MSRRSSPQTTPTRRLGPTGAQADEELARDDATEQSPVQVQADQTDAVAVRHATRSREGRSVITFPHKNGLRFADVEPFGDPETIEHYLVRPSTNPDFIEVGWGGGWSAVSLETGRLTVDEHVE